MLYGFEQETAPLNEIEKSAAIVISRCLTIHHQGQERAVTAQHIANGMANDSKYRDAKGRPYLNGARIRKIVNYLRVNGICPNLIASSKGYYVSNNREELVEYINSLRSRAEAINAVAVMMEGAL